MSAAAAATHNGTNGSAHGHSHGHSASAALKLHVVHCFDAMLENLFDQPALPAVKHSWNGDKFPLFVTWKKRSSSSSEWRLRGCIGTFSAKELGAGLKEYSVIAAFHDSRFSPIEAGELVHLRCDISLLTRFEHVTGATAVANGTQSKAAQPLHDWVIGRHGITIEFSCPSTSKRFNATFLPEVASEQGWSHSQTLSELVHKSGYRGSFDSALQKRVSLTRYQSDKEGLSWSQYVSLREQLTGAPMPPLKHAAGAAKMRDELEEDDDDEAEEAESDEDLQAPAAAAPARKAAATNGVRK